VEGPVPLTASGPGRSMLYVAPVAETARGGASRHVEGMTASLRSGGWDVTVVTPRRRRFGWASRLGFEAAAVVRVAAHVLTKKPTTVYTRIGPTNLLVLLRPLFRARGVAFFGELNGPPSVEFLNRPGGAVSSQIVESWISLQLRASDGVRCVSPRLVEYAAALGAKNAFHIPNASAIRPVGEDEATTVRPPGPWKLVFAGVEAPWYELELWEQVVRESPHWRLLVCTDSRGDAVVRARSADLIEAGRVQLHGWLDPEKLREVLCGADFALLPLGPKHPTTDVIGSPLKLYDYLRLRLPIIATTVDGVPRSLEGKGVRFYEFGDKVSAAQCLDNAQRDFALCREEAAGRDPSDDGWEKRAIELSEMLNG